MPVNLPTDQVELQAFVDRRHPAFYARLPHWKFCESTFEGGRDWFAQNIHEYMKEGTREYSDRLTRAYRFNHTKEVVQLVTKYIFKEGVIRNVENAPAPVKKFWNCATLDGQPIDTLMKQASNLSSQHGRVYIVVDSKNTGNSPVTVADEKNGVTRTYAYLVKIEDVLDFAKDEFGKLIWILFKTKHRDDANPVSSSGQVRNRFMLWTVDEWIILEEIIKEDAVAGPAVALIVGDPSTQSAIAASVMASLTSAQMEAVAAMKNEQVREIVVIARGPNGLNEIPVIECNHIESTKQYDPPGLIDDIAYLDRAVANYLSNIDAIIQDQTFSQLVMPMQNLAPGEEAYDKMIEMGTKRLFLYDGESGIAPTYISPDANNATLIVSVIKTIIGEIYHSVGMAGERTKQDNSMGIDNSSGVAKAYDFDRMNALLAAKADQLDRSESLIAYFVERYAGTAQEDTALLNNDDMDITRLIKYPDDYDVRGLPDEFDIAQSLMLLEAPDSVRRQQMLNIVAKLFPRLAKALIEKMQSELADWPVDPLDTMADQLALTAKYSLGNTSGTNSMKTAPPAAPGAPAGGAKSASPTSPKPAAKPASGKKKNRQGENNG
jgi:hypothetical protein